VLAVIGGHDSFTPDADVADLRATGAEVVVYPEGEHGFAHDASRPTHRADDAADAFARAMAFLGG
jgi:carboxymethylenebutenolidase